MMQTKNMVKSATTVLLVFMLVNIGLYQLAQAAAGAATASGGAGVSTTSAASSAGTDAAATTTDQAATTTTTTSTTTSDSNSASAAATTSQGNNNNNGPFSAVQSMVGGAFNIASMPLNTISASLNQMGLPNVATAPFGAITNLFHQAGSVYGK